MEKKASTPPKYRKREMAKKSVQQVLDEQRTTRSVDMEIALQDFLDLPSHEQLEFLFTGLLTTHQLAEWMLKHGFKRPRT